MTTEKSNYQKLEDKTRQYYGADRNPLRFAPVVKNKDIAHELALDVERSLGYVTDEDLTASAIRAERRARSMPGHPDRGRSLDELRNEALDDRLRRIVVQTELSHARLAPEDFNEDQEKSGAYEMGNGGTASHKL